MRKRTKDRLYNRVFIPLISGGIGVFILFFLLKRPDLVQKLGGNRGVLTIVSGIIVLTSIVLMAARPLFKKFRGQQIQFTSGIKYEAGVERVKPEFDSDNVFRSFIFGGVFGVLSVGFGYLVADFFFSVNRSLQGFGSLSLVDIWFALLAIPSFLFLGWASYSGIKKGVATIFQRRAWFADSRKVEAVIVDRQVEEIVHKKGKNMLRHELILKIGGQLFWATVSERIFRRNVGRDLVNVFYVVGSPEVFVIEGE